MEKALKAALGTSKLVSIGRAGGCISDGCSYDTDVGQVFVKVNTKSEARRMFVGEKASLEAISKTETVRVPKPVKLLDHPEGSGAVLVMEHLDMASLHSQQANLGKQLARLHLHNIDLLNKADKSDSEAGDTTGACTAVHQFGFHVPTCCGFLPQDNEWSDNWVEFYARQRLQTQLTLVEKDYSDREARQLWSQLEPKIPSFFDGIDVKPSLLHGDLWSGNAGQVSFEPVIFDPASFYGHSEFDLAISTMFSGFTSAFYKAYHALIPKAPGFETRQELYRLFHYLNHWNHFGSSYRSQSLSIMRSLVKG